MLVNVRELKPGMILLRDLAHDGNVILKAKSVLSAHIISVLKIRGITRVDIEETSEHHAPGADVYYKMALKSDDNSSAIYEKTKKDIETLFAAAEQDAQTMLLKYCIIRQLEEKHFESD